MVKKSISINLKKGQSETGLDKFIDWALTIGRVLVIITEFVALLAFLYRFSLDQQLSDINTKIKQEESIVAYFKKNEDTYRNLQDRLSLASTSIEESFQRVKIYNDIVGFAPKGFTFNSITLYSDRVQIVAEATSVSPLSYFIDSLKGYSAIDSVALDKVENKISSASIGVSITANLKQNFKIDETSN